MFKSYQLILSIALLFACFNLETSFARNFVSNYRRPNATRVRPASSYQPGINNTRPYNERFNETRVQQPLQSSSQFGAPHYQGTVQQPNIGFNNNLIGSNTFQSNGTHRFNPQAQAFPNGSPQQNYSYSFPLNYTKSTPSNATHPYARLFKLW